MKNRVILLLVTGGCMVLSSSLFAHHSAAVYDGHTLVTLKATVTKFEFINPHTVIHLDVQDKNGNVEHWMAGGGSPVIMRRIGWTPNYLKPGEKVIISGFAMKDGRKVMLQGKLVRADSGEELPTSQTEKVHVDELLEHHHAKSLEELPAQVHREYGVFD